MENKVIENLEKLLSQSIDDYLLSDPFGIYFLDPQKALQIFSSQEIADLEKKLEFIESDLLNLLFLADDIYPLEEGTVSVLNITDNIIIVKEEENYKCYKLIDGNPRIFNIINSNSYNYLNFKSELVRFFREPSKENSQQKIIKHSINA